MTTKPSSDRLAAAAIVAAIVAANAAHAQKPTPTASPAVKPSPTASASPKRSVTFTATRPGTYSIWANGGADGGIQKLAGSEKPTAKLSLDSGVTEVDVLDDAGGTVAVFPADKLKSDDVVNVAPADFKYVEAVRVAVTANGGKPVEKAAVTLTDSAGHAVSRVVTAGDRGVATFKPVLIGKATVKAAYGSDGPKITQETTIAPAKGGNPVEVTLPLTGDVPTLADSPAPGDLPGGGSTTSARSTAEANEPRANNWVPGVVGLCLMGAAIWYGIKYAREHGLTVAGTLKQIGVEMPQDGVGGPGPSHLKPAAPVLPPLPSLTDLPAAGPAPSAAGAGVASSVARLVGVSGAVTGEVFPLDMDGGAFSLGRDETNALALTQDKGVSRRHARFERGGDGWAVVDEGSSNGTFVNGARVAALQTLRAGDEIQVGGARFRFEG